MSPMISPNVFKNACGIDCYFQLSTIYPPLPVLNTHTHTVYAHSQHYIFLNTLMRTLLLLQGSRILLIGFRLSSYLVTNVCNGCVLTIVPVATDTAFKPVFLLMQLLMTCTLSHTHKNTCFFHAEAGRAPPLWSLKDNSFPTVHATNDTGILLSRILGREWDSLLEMCLLRSFMFCVIAPVVSFLLPCTKRLLLVQRSHPPLCRWCVIAVAFA